MAAIQRKSGWLSRGYSIIVLQTWNQTIQSAHQSTTTILSFTHSNHKSTTCAKSEQWTISLSSRYGMNIFKLLFINKNYSNYLNRIIFCIIVPVCRQWLIWNSMNRELFLSKRFFLLSLSIFERKSKKTNQNYDILCYFRAKCHSCTVCGADMKDQAYLSFDFQTCRNSRYCLTKQVALKQKSSLVMYTSPHKLIKKHEHYNWIF